MCFFFNDTATTEIYTLSLHDALPISVLRRPVHRPGGAHAQHPAVPRAADLHRQPRRGRGRRSEEHTSELQSRQYLVCRLLLEKTNSNACSVFHVPPHPVSLSRRLPQP